MEVTYSTFIIFRFSRCLWLSLLTVGPSELLQPYISTFKRCVTYTSKRYTFTSRTFLVVLLRAAAMCNHVCSICPLIASGFENWGLTFSSENTFDLNLNLKRNVLLCITELQTVPCKVQTNCGVGVDIFGAYFVFSNMGYEAEICE